MNIGCLRKYIDMKRVVIGLVATGVILSLTVTVMHYQSRLERYGSDIATLRRSVAEMSVQQRHLMIRAKRSTRNGRRLTRDVSEDVELVPGTVSAYGVAYTRWGRRDCNGNAEMLYHGYTAESHHAHIGGGSNHLCLHRNVTYKPGRFRDGHQGGSYIYGVEYYDGSWVNNLMDATGTTETGSVYQHTVPCAVCIARFKVTQIMIPGRDICPDNWLMEYSGFIMAEHHNDKHASQYICVDKNPQVVPNTQGAQNGGRLYIVETSCPSLVCEPYVIGREIPCVVCSI